MGDAAIGMSGMDIETAVRHEIPILTIVLNNHVLSGYARNYPTATDAFRSEEHTSELQSRTNLVCRLLLEKKKNNKNKHKKKKKHDANNNS